MAVKLPDAQDLGIVTPQATRPVTSYQGGIAQQGEEAAGQGIARLGQGITEGASSIQLAQDHVDYASAYNNFLQKKLDLDQQFQKDPDYATAPQRYSQALTDLATDTSGQIKNADLRSQFIDITARTRGYAIERVLQQSHEKGVDADRAYLFNQTQNTLDASGQATDDVTRNGLFASHAALIDAMAAKGSITQLEAAKMKEDMPRAYAMQYFQGLIHNNPHAAAALLGGNAPPIAKDMPIDAAVAIHSAVEQVPGADEATLARTWQIEHPRPGQGRVNPLSGASGDFQMMPATARAYGVTDALDVNQSAIGTAKLQVDNIKQLSGTLGRPPTPAETYLAHQQGAGGAAALIQNPDMPAVSALISAGVSPGVARQSIVNNGGSANMTAGDFVSKWRDTFNQSPGVGTKPTPQMDEHGQPIPVKYGDLRDFLRPDQQAALGEQAVNYAQRVDNAAIIDQERQERLRNQAVKMASDNAMGRLIADVGGVGQNPHVTAQQIADPVGPYKDLTPEARMQATGFLERQNRADPNEALSKQTTNGLLSGILAPDGDPKKITTMGPIIDAVNKDQLSRGDFTFLQTQLQTATSRTDYEKQMLNGVMEGLHVTVSQHAPGLPGGGRDPIGETKWGQAQAAMLSAYDTGRKAGKTPQQLLSQDSPDYIGKLAQPFMRSNAEKMRDYFNANNPDIDNGVAKPAAGKSAAPTIDLNTPQGIVAAYRTGYFGSGPEGHAKASAELVKRGFAAPDAAPAAPSAPTGEQ